MNCINTFIIFFNLFTLIACRSLDSDFDKREMDENEYESDDSEDKEDIENEDQAEEKGEEKRGINEHQLIDFSGNTYLQRLAEERSDRSNRDQQVAEKYKTNELDAETGDSIDTSNAQLHPKIGMFNKYVNKHTEFKNFEKKEPNDYYNSGNNQKRNHKNIMQDSSSRRKCDEGKESNRQLELNFNRDKRNINGKPDDKGEQKLYDNDVSIIKEHIKRLSKNEFNDLLHALSDSNIEILKNIFDDDNKININKRDITKKAGAIADSFLNDNNQLDFKDKLHANEANSETTACTKLIEKKNVDQPESEDITVKESEMSNSTPVTEINKTSPSPNHCADNDTTSNQNKIKMELCELKTQGLVEDLDDNYSQQLSLDYPSYSHNDISKFVEYNSQDNNNNKREINDNLKYLQDSFPNSNNIDNSYLDTPLVRVKRRNQHDIKRKHDSECNLNNYKDNKESYGDYESLVSNELQEEEYDKSGFKSDSSKIGSDTDNVFSNVEEMNNNLMFNSGVRSRRSFNNYEESDNDNSQNNKTLTQNC